MVTNRDVPGISLIGIPIKYIIAGTNKNAPPTPIRAATNPVKIPNMIGVKALSYNLDLGNLSLNGSP